MDKLQAEYNDGDPDKTHHDVSLFDVSLSVVAYMLGLVGRNKHSVISNKEEFFRNRFYQYLNLTNMARSMRCNSTNKNR